MVELVPVLQKYTKGEPLAQQYIHNLQIVQFSNFFSNKFIYLNINR
jgi:hypothetical protein